MKVRGIVCSFTLGLSPGKPDCWPPRNTTRIRGTFENACYKLRRLDAKDRISVSSDVPMYVRANLPLKNLFTWPYLLRATDALNMFNVAIKLQVFLYLAFDMYCILQKGTKIIWLRLRR